MVRRLGIILSSVWGRSWTPVVLPLVLSVLAACDSSSQEHSSNLTPNGSDIPSPGVSRGGATEPSQWVERDAVQPYHLHSPYASVLADCALVTHEQDSCLLSTLPFLVHQGPAPDIEQILDRVLVSHQWMGDRFAQLLAQMPDDILILFKPVTAIVIAADVRPSYYWAGSGTVYLDPLLLWLKPEEKQLFTVNFEHDHGVGGDDSLAFHTWWRYVAGNRPAYQETSLEQSGQRTLSDLLLPLAALLFHELAHANDFFPPQYRSQIQTDLTVAEAAYQQWGRRPSDHLWMQTPLKSEPLFRFAEILYSGQRAPTDSEKHVTAAEIAAEFDRDSASDDYAYISQYEDLAMLFEEAMMHYHFGLKRDIAYLEKPAEETGVHCDEYQVEWGSRHRIARKDIKLRAQQVTEALLPDTHWSPYFSTLSAPQPLVVGAGWCESAALTVQVLPRAASKSLVPWTLPHHSRHHRPTQRGL